MPNIDKGFMITNLSEYEKLHLNECVFAMIQFISGLLW